LKRLIIMGADALNDVLSTLKTVSERLNLESMDKVFVYVGISILLLVALAYAIVGLRKFAAAILKLKVAQFVAVLIILGIVFIALGVLLP